MATIAQTLTAIANTIGLQAPSNFYGNSDPTAARLLQAALSAGRYLASSRNWRELTFEHSFTTTSGQLTYALPTSPRFHHFYPVSGYDRDNSTLLIGPVPVHEFQRGKAETLSPVGIQHRFRIRASANHATPELAFVDDPGGAYSLAFEYVTDQWVNQGGGTYSDTVLADSNEPVFDHYLFECQTRWRALRTLGEPFAAELDEANRTEEQTYSRQNGSLVRLAPSRVRFMENIPEGNWPTS